MLTRLEVDGFRNLRGLAVELGPFTVIAGPNGVGKSNLFDALDLLGLLADLPFAEAARRLRGGAGGSARELFTASGADRATRMRFAAEMILPPQVEDDFGRVAEPSITFVRYELELGWAAPDDRALLGRLTLEREQLTQINLGEAHHHLRFPHRADRFRDAVVRGRRGAPLISTDEEGGRRLVRIHQDGVGGQPQPSPADEAPGSLLRSVTSSAFPTALATRRELQSWRRMALDPAALRRPDAYSDPLPAVGSDGAHLPAALFRLAHQAGASPEAVVARVAGLAAELVDLEGLRVDRDDARELLTLMARPGGGPELPARALSDGALRVLALCVLRADPALGGLVALEEPENGLLPARMRPLVALLRGMAVDPTQAPGPANPLRQVLVNTHSPGFVQLAIQAAPGDVLLALPGPEGPRLHPVEGTWRCDQDEPGLRTERLLSELTDPPGAQLGLALGARRPSRRR